MTDLAYDPDTFKVVAVPPRDVVRRLSEQQGGSGPDEREGRELRPEAKASVYVKGLFADLDTLEAMAERTHRFADELVRLAAAGFVAQPAGASVFELRYTGQANVVDDPGLDAEPAAPSDPEQVGEDHDGADGDGWLPELLLYPKYDLPGETATVAEMVAACRSYAVWLTNLAGAGWKIDMNDGSHVGLVHTWRAEPPA